MFFHARLPDSGWVEYEPESFPRLVCRLTDPKVVFLLFSSGKAVIKGGTNLPDIRRGFEIFREIWPPFFSVPFIHKKIINSEL